VKGILIVTPARLADSSTAVLPAKTMRSASESFFPPAPDLLNFV